jgi:hypothetical protein
MQIVDPRLGGYHRKKASHLLAVPDVRNDTAVDSE